MHKLKPFFNGPKTDDGSEYHKSVRFIRESCKIFSEFYKLEKDFINKSVDSEIAKSLRELTTDMTSNYRPSSILKNTMNDLLSIHEYIDNKRKEWFDKLRFQCEQAKEKQLLIRQIMSDNRENYERTVKKYEAADSNLKKFQSRSDRSSILNYADRLSELETIRDDCKQAQSTANDIYIAETYRIASEEHSITKQFFAQYLFDQQKFYQNIEEIFSKQIPEIERRLENNPLAPSFHCDLAEHCSRIQRPIAYPIETSIRLLKDSLHEEGLFRQGSNPNKQKRFISELDLQIIDKTMKLQDLSCDAYVPANTLKQYLRELPECLLTEKLLPQWNQISSISDEKARVERLDQLIKQLPKVNSDNLCYIIRFLHRVTTYSSENKMTSSNLAVCIGNSLIYSKDPSATHFVNGALIIQLMIDYHQQLFPDENLSKNPFGSSENLVDTDLPQPFVSIKTSGKHRAAPPPPIPRPSVRLNPSPPTGETSTEQEPITDKSNLNESPGRSSLTKMDRLQNRSRSMTSSPKKENEISDCNNNPTNQSNPISSHSENLFDSPGEITKF